MVHKGFSPILIIAVIALLAIGGGGLYLVQKRLAPPPIPTEPAPPPPPPSPGTSACPPGTVQVGETTAIPPAPICEPAPPGPPSQKPSISSLSPTRGPVNTRVTIRGTGFTASANTVKFGIGYVGKLDSSDGTTIRFNVPGGHELCPPDSSGPCPGAFPKVMPGVHAVSVTNRNGTSNALPFTVIPEAGPPPPGTCDPPVECAAPPVGCTYRGATSCTCGTIVCDVTPPPPPPTPPPPPAPPPPAPPPPPLPPPPQTLNITLEADDRGFYPSGTVTVPQGATVKLTFKVRTENVYYGGLDFRSPKFNTPSVKPGESTSVEFTADQSFEFRSYWPASGVLKAVGMVSVK